MTGTAAGSGLESPSKTRAGTRLCAALGALLPASCTALLVAGVLLWSSGAARGGAALLDGLRGTKLLPAGALASAGRALGTLHQATLVCLLVAVCLAAAATLASLLIACAGARGGGPRSPGAPTEAAHRAPARPVAWRWRPTCSQRATCLHAL